LYWDAEEFLSTPEGNMNIRKSFNSPLNPAISQQPGFDLSKNLDGEKNGTPELQNRATIHTYLSRNPRIIRHIRGGGSGIIIGGKRIDLQEIVLQN
jgi:hypothetical protein